MTVGLDHTYWRRVLDRATDPETAVEIDIARRGGKRETVCVCIYRTDSPEGPIVEVGHGELQVLCGWHQVRSITTTAGVPLDELAERLDAEEAAAQ